MPNRTPSREFLHRLLLLVAAVLATLAPHPSAAHDGPPYPILVDHQTGPYTMSVWADPDVGTGTFYFVFEGPAPEEIEVWVQPVDGRLPEEKSLAKKEPGRNQIRFTATARFDTQEWWRTRFVVRGPAGAGEAETKVEVTPPGLGPIDLLLYLAPFLAVAFLWINATLRRRRARAPVPAPRSPSESTPPSGPPHA